jgi:HEAT repeat protein
MTLNNGRTIARQIRLAVVALLVSTFAWGQQSGTASELIQQFKSTPIFWQQFEVAKKVVALHDRSVLPRIESWLGDDDRHLRGNVAFVFASLGDDRGFQVITDILRDTKGKRPPGQGVATAPWSLRKQIITDRYYAAHLLGDLRDPRAVPILVPLLKDQDVNYIVPWSLGEIGDTSAIPPLIETLYDENPDMRVLAIYALKKLKAKEALPRIRAMVNDNERIHFDGLGTVAEAARAAIVELADWHYWLTQDCCF